MAKSEVLYSFVVPVYNESASLGMFHEDLLKTVTSLKESHYEIIYINDGSLDSTPETLSAIVDKDFRVRLITLSRNFGKEIAVTAGVNQAKGSAIITLDADGQHPPHLIPDFVKAWKDGAKVVIGLRTDNHGEGLVKRYGSRVFYKILGIKLKPGATDYRLIDQSVAQDFKRMTERNRITRGLVEWLGYEPVYIKFSAPARAHGQATYTFKKLFKLAINSMISLSLSPLYITAYIGAVVLPLSALLGVGMIFNALIGDPLSLHATGSAYVIVFMLFLIGILLVSQGIIGLYLSHIHTETQNRPLYIIDKQKSKNLG